MAKIDVSFANAKVYDVSKFDVKLGEKFSLTLYDNADTPELEWFWSNDPVLQSETPVSQVAEVTATKAGTSKLHLVTSDNKVMKLLIITVVEEVKDQAVSLGLEAAPPEYK